MTKRRSTSGSKASQDAATQTTRAKNATRRRTTSTETSVDDNDPVTLRRSARNADRSSTSFLKYDGSYHPIDDEIRPHFAARRKQAHGVNANLKLTSRNSSPRPANRLRSDRQTDHEDNEQDEDGPSSPERPYSPHSPLEGSKASYLSFEEKFQEIIDKGLNKFEAGLDQAVEQAIQRLHETGRTTHSPSSSSQADNPSKRMTIEEIIEWRRRRAANVSSQPGEMENDRKIASHLRPQAASSSRQTVNNSKRGPLNSTQQNGTGREPSFEL